MEAQFDHTASGYDAEFSHTQVGRMQRAQTWAWLAAHLEPDPKRILELNCGTGEDAAWLVAKGWQVTASDISAEMLQVTASKLRGKEVELLQSPMQGLAALLPARQFDWVWSNFGGLNCLSPEELGRFAKDLGQLLPKGGKVAVVVMGKFCLWESLYFLAKFKFGQVFRRFSKKPLKARLADGIFQDTWYFGPRELQRMMGQDFRLIDQVPIGIGLPPSYLDPFFSKRPRLLRRMEKVEKLLAQKAWAAHFSDHFLLAFERK